MLACRVSFPLGLRRRLQELHEARTAHVNIEAGTWTVPAENRKGRQKDKLYHLHPETIEVYKATQPARRKKVFPFPYVRRQLQVYLSKILKHAGLPSTKNTSSIVSAVLPKARPPRQKESSGPRMPWGITWQWPGQATFPRSSSPRPQVDRRHTADSNRVGEARRRRRWWPRSRQRTAGNTAPPFCPRRCPARRRSAAPIFS